MLVLEAPSGEVTAVEVKRTLAPKLAPGFRESMETLGATRGCILMPDGEPFPLSESVTAQPLSQFLKSFE